MDDSPLPQLPFDAKLGSYVFGDDSRYADGVFDRLLFDDGCVGGSRIAAVGCLLRKGLRFYRYGGYLWNDCPSD